MVGFCVLGALRGALFLFVGEFFIVVFSPEEEKFRKIISDYGWHVMQVRNREEEEGPTFSYSTGLWQSFKHPEIIVFGLSSDLEHSIINSVGEDINSGKRTFKSNSYYDGFLEGFKVFMIETQEPVKSEYATWADWYYNREDFPILQCVWPTTSGIWPWDEDADQSLLKAQPLLSKNYKT